MAEHQLRTPWAEALPSACLAGVLAHLQSTDDRRSLRAVCRSWQHAADNAFRRAAYVCSWLPPAPPSFQAQAELASGTLVSISQPKTPALQRFLRGSFLLSAIRSLDLVELRSSFKLAELLRLLCPAACPHLESLGISTPLGETWTDGGALADLALAPQLRCLRLYDILVEGGLPSLTHLRALTELSLAGAVNAASTEVAQADSISCLTALSALQALTLPAVEQEGRQQLSLLTGLTRLHFEALGEGAVGSSLLGLIGLQDLRVALHHRRDMFIVLHPALEYDALAQLTGLTSLELSNLAAYAWNRMPEVDWTDQPPPAEQALRLLSALPALRRLTLRAAFCRVPGETADSEDGRQLPVALSHGRCFSASLQRVPRQRPGHRRPAEWYEAWWQEDVQSAMERSLGPDCSSLRVLREHLHDTSGWVLLNPAVPKSYDVLAEWQRQD